MKTCTLLTFALIAASTPLLGQTILFEDDFSTGISKWTAPNNNTNPTDRVIEVTNTNSETYFGTAEDNYLRMFQIAAPGQSGAFSLASANRFSQHVFTVTFDFWDNPAVGAGQWIMRVGTSGVSSAQTAFDLQFKKGSIGHSNNAAQTNSEAYETGQRNSIALVFNTSTEAVSYDGGTLAAQSMDVWINDGTGNSLVVSDFARNGSLDTSAGVALENIQLGIFNGQQAEVFIDNFVVYQGAIPEPSTYALGAGFLALGAAAFWRRRRSA